MRRILLILFVALSVVLLGQQVFDYVNIIEEAEGLEKYENDLFSVAFDYFLGEETGVTLLDNNEMFQLGFLVFTRKSTEVKSITIERLSVVSSTSFSTGIIYKITPDETKALNDINEPVAFDDSGKLVFLILNDVNPGKEYYLNTMIDANEINWHIDITKAKAVNEKINQNTTEYIDILKKGLENKISNLENQLSITEMQVNSLKANDSDFENIDATHKILIDQLEENIQALNIQFKKLNTLFLDSQLGLGEFRGTSEAKFQSYETRLNELNQKVVEFASVGDTAEATISELEDEFDVLKAEIPTFKSDISSLNGELNGIIDQLNEFNKKWESSAKLTENIEMTNQASFTNMNERIGNLYSVLEDLQKTLDEDTTVDPEVSSAVEELKTQVSDLLKQYKALTEVVITLTMDINGLKTSGDTSDEELKIYIDDLNMKIDGALSSINVLRNASAIESATPAASVAELETRMFDLQEEISKLENLSAVFAISSAPEFIAAFKDMGATIEVLKTDFSELSAEIEAINNNAGELKDLETNDGTEMKINIANFEIRVNELGNKLVSLEENLSGLASNTFKRIIELSKSIENLDVRVNEVSYAIDNSSDYEVLDEKLMTAGDQLELLFSKYVDLEEEMKEFNKTEIDLEDSGSFKMTFSDFENELAALKTELKTIKEKQIEMETKSLSDSRNLESLSGNFEGAIMAMDGNLKMIRKLQEDLNEVRNSLNTISDSMQTLFEQKTEVDDDQLVQIEKKIALVETRNSLAIEEAKSQLNSQVMIAIGAGLLGILVGALGFLAK